MKNFLCLTIFTIFITSCSFDDKSGIWTETEKLTKKKNKDLELIFKSSKDDFKEQELSTNKKLDYGNVKTYKNWEQRYQNNFNNIGNLDFSNVGNYEKFSKISKANTNKNILLSKNNLIFSDQKGNIGVISLENKELIYEFNFYKKKFKGIKKIIQLAVKDNNIVVADNFGYIYSLDYVNNKLLWAKNYMIPFRSNIKIIDNTLFISDEKNKIVLIDINNGKKIEEFYTLPSKTVSKFKSNLALDRRNNLLFLSTTGTLYSLNLVNNKTINWIQNFNLNNEITFDSNPVVVSKDKIIISTYNKLSVLNEIGRVIWEIPIELNVLPVVSGNTIIAITKDNNLVIFEKQSGQILFSKNIFSIMDGEYKKKYKRKIKKISHIHLLNKKLLLISDNSFFIEFDLNQTLNLSSIKKKPFIITSDIIFSEKKMILVGDGKRLYRIN